MFFGSKIGDLGTPYLYGVDEIPSTSTRPAAYSAQLLLSHKS